MEVGRLMQRNSTAIAFGIVIGCGGTDPATTTRPSGVTESSAAGDETGASSGSSSSAATAGTTAAGTSTTTPDEGADESSGAGSTTESVPPNATPENLRVAFFGDHGLGPDSIATLQLVLAEDADFLVILGDFDYDDDPSAWHEQLDEGIGEDFPIFAVAGNHDKAAWDGYREVLMDRLEPIKNVDCQGEIGVQMNCLYQGVDLVLSGVGTMPAPGETSHEDYIAQTLEQSDAIWKVCAWHKNQHDMQLGGKSNEVGWGAYQACQGGGAIIATGHEHTYGRTRTLTDLGNHDAGHGAVGEVDTVTVGPGATFVFVSGMGGNEIRDFEADHADDTWWATQYTSNVFVQNGDPVEDFEAKLGVMFIDFYVDGDPYKARGYFKNLAGEMIDEFTIFAQH